jgi:hypothetical protein
MNRQNIIQKLKQEIAQGRVVVIAGTGVSIAACGNQEIEGYAVASRAGLLRHGLAYCRHLNLADQEDVRVLGSQIKSNKTNFLISAAEDISKRLHSHSPGVFRGWLQNTVGDLEPKHPDILRSLATLPCVLATLNYDGLFEKATDRHEPVTWTRPD